MVRNHYESVLSTDEHGSDGRRKGVHVSIVIPMLNEEANIADVYRELVETLRAEPIRYEMIFIDDGSTDETVSRLRQAVGDDPRVRLIEFARRFGQTAALAAGFEHARGRVIVPMDGDCQNDPRDIPRLVAKLNEAPGWDIVSGWRKNRQDRMFSRRLPSVLANRLIRRFTWTDEIHDFGCTLKAYRRDVLEDVHLYGEMHRFLPAICKWRGARVAELVVNHRPRRAGNSKYGLRRTVKVLLDLTTVKFLGDYLTKPIYFFGKAAMIMMGLAMLACMVAVVQKFGALTEHGSPVNLNDNIFLFFGMMAFLMSVLFIMMGVLSELLVRIYHEAQDRRPYKIRRIRTGKDMTRTDAHDWNDPSDPIVDAEEAAEPMAESGQV